MQYYGRPVFLINIVSRVLKVVVLIVVVFMPVREVLAANWIYLQRHEGTMLGTCTEYMDADSVVKENKTVTYWNIRVFDEKQERNNIKKILFKKKIDMTIVPFKTTTMEQHFFSEDNREIKRDLKPVVSPWKLSDEVNRALGYAKDIYTLDKPRPDHVATPQVKWDGPRAYGDCEIYCDASSIVAWPHSKPTTIDIRLKQVWNSAGIIKRKAFLATKEPYLHNENNDVNYTVLTCRVLINKPKIHILEVTDYDRDNCRITLLDGDSDWKDVKQGSLEEVIRSIALDWVYSVNNRR